MKKYHPILYHNKNALHAEIRMQFSCLVAKTNVTFSGYDLSLPISQREWEGVPFFPFPLAPISIPKKKRLLRIKEVQRRQARWLFS